MANSPSVIGIFGGAFDPVHYAHYALAQAAIQELGVQQVLWVPAGNTPHRAPTEASPAQRLAMVRLAIQDEANFAVDTYDVDNLQVSRTVPTLQRLRANYGAQASLLLLLGADAFVTLPTWYRWRELFDLADIAVAERPGTTINQATMPEALQEEFRNRHLASPINKSSTMSGGGCGRIITFSPTALLNQRHIPTELSASLLRHCLRHDPTRAATLTPPAVLRYIQQHHLYTTPPTHAHTQT